MLDHFQPLRPPVAKKLFKKFQVYNKRGTKTFKKEQYKRFSAPGKHPDIPIHDYGCRQTGIRHEAYWEHIPEMVPELIVPDLTDFPLKPYVSYATKEIYQAELTSKDIFNVIYGKKIIRDFRAGQLDEEGNPLNPSPPEKQTAEMALAMAQQTGSDIFQGGEPEDKEWTLDYDIGKLN